MKQMTVGHLRGLLAKFPNERIVMTTSRIKEGTRITAINFVGEDKNGNLVITLDDSLLKSLS